MVVQLTVHVAEFARQNGGATGGADRIGDKSLVEARSFVRDTVDVRRVNQARVICTYGFEGMVVCENEEYVGWRFMLLAAAQHLSS
jgi:hypothetical protein